jgi:hypothetical protein
MDTCPRHIALASVLLLIAILACAGCASIPGPDARFTPVPTTTPVPVTPQAKVMTMKTTALPVTVATPAPAVVATAAATPPPQPAAVTGSCADQGGSIAGAGEECPGSWLVAANTFNCCSHAPVRSAPANASIVVGPFDPVIVMDDDPGSILS